MTKSLPAALLLLPALAAAQPASEPAAPAPAKENDALKPFIQRKWSCDDTTRLGPNAPEVKVKTEYRFKRSIDDFWFFVSYEQKKQKDFPGFYAEATFGWDGGRKQYVLVGFDNAGGMIDLSAATAGELVTWTGQLHVPGGGNAPMKFTWTKKSSREALFVIEAQLGDAWVKFSEATCKPG